MRHSFLFLLRRKTDKKTFQQGVRALFFIAMTYTFGATKTDLEKAFRLKAASKSKTNKQKLESLEFTESELATILFEHPILGSLADYPNGRLLG